MSGLTQAGSSVVGALGNYTTQAAANAANLGTLAGSKLVELGNNGAYYATQAGIDAGLKAGEITGESAGKFLGENAAKKGLGALGTSMSIAGAAYGAYNMANAIADYSNHMNASQMQDMSSKSTEQRNGVQYLRYGGIDTNAISDYTHQ